MEVTLDLLVEDWLNDNLMLKDHFKVFRYSECENPTSWPGSFDNYLGMLCSFNRDEVAFIIKDNYVFCENAFNNKHGSVLVRTRLEAADPEFFRSLASHLAIKHQRHHGPRGCKLYDLPSSDKSNTRIFDD